MRLPLTRALTLCVRRCGRAAAFAYARLTCGQMTCVEDKTFSAEYHDPEKRFIGNALKIKLKDGTELDEACSLCLLVRDARSHSGSQVAINFPVGHKRRREEGTPLLNAKFERHIAPHFSQDHVQTCVNVSSKQIALHELTSYLHNQDPQKGCRPEVARTDGRSLLC